VLAVSIESVLDRLNALQAMLDSASGPPATGDTAAFSSALATAASSTDAGTGSGASNATFASLASPLGAAAATPAATGISALPDGTPYGAEITASAERNALDPALLAGLIKQESGFKPDARSSAGAQGLTQLMPGTAAGLGVTDPLDPAQAIDGGAKYLKQQLDRFGGDTARALAAYNAGPGAVQRFGGVPPYAETQNYVRAVQANAASFRSSTTTA
jgi:soluble lytic murein transglycosylase-like protein